MKIKWPKRIAHFEQPRQWESMRIAKELEAKGMKMLHFEEGDFTGYRTPDVIAEAAIKAIKEGYTKYVPGPGLPELREAIAEEMERRGRPTDPEEVIVTSGAKFALTCALLTIIDEGDEVIFPNPGYPPDEFWIKYVGGKPVYAPLTRPDFQWDIDALQELITDKTKMIIVNTPQRPNGMVVKNVKEIAEVAIDNDILVLSDEIFSKMVYPPNKHVSIASVPGMEDRTIVVDTFSKPYIMTGWRIGWAVAPKEIIEKMSIFLQNSITNVAAFVQKAAYVALTHPEAQEANKNLVKDLQKKRDRIVNKLRGVPEFKVIEPEGAFYVFPNIEGTGKSSKEFTRYLMEKYGVAVVAGTAFGSNGEGHIRMTFAVPNEVIDEGVERIKAAVESLGG